MRQTGQKHTDELKYSVLAGMFRLDISEMAACRKLLPYRLPVETLCNWLHHKKLLKEFALRWQKEEDKPLPPAFISRWCSLNSLVPSECYDYSLGELDLRIIGVNPIKVSDIDFGHESSIPEDVLNQIKIMSINLGVLGINTGVGPFNKWPTRVFRVLCARACAVSLAHSMALVAGTDTIHKIQQRAKQGNTNAIAFLRACESALGMGLAKVHERIMFSGRDSDTIKLLERCLRDDYSTKQEVAATATINPLKDVSTSELENLLKGNE